MEKKSKPVARKGLKVKSKLTKIITFFTCLVLILVSICMYIQPTYGIGYKYYENNTIQIGVTQQENKFSKTLEEYLDELGENGYYVCSTEINKDITNKFTVIRKSEINDEQLRQIIRDSFVVSVFATKLSIEGDDNTYYFKSEDECNKFVNDLKEYNEDIVTTIESDIVEVEKITAEQTLKDKVEKYRLDREAKDAEAAAKAEAARKAAERNKTVTSRGGYERRTNSTGARHPLDSYTYISSGYGQRWGKLHTGTDFATPTGTAVHAWKAGKVIYASWCGGYGNYVRIQHDDGTESCYAHLSSYACSVGEYVGCHDVIAYSGSTGNSTGSHLHFEIKVNGSFVNPLNYL